MQFGVIGCGRISQIMHLPNLDEIPDTTIHAIADPAENLLESMGEKYRVPHRYRDGTELIDDLSDELDAVVIATPPQVHREVAVAALETGLHTLVEKPLALTEEDANALVDAAEGSDAVAMVGYMKRHDPTYLLMKEKVDDLKTINNVTGTLVLGQHDEVIDEVYDLVPAELGSEFLEASGTARYEQASQAIGTDDADLTAHYQSHLGGSCHDLSALRGLLGDIDRIEYVDLHSDYDVLNAYLVFEGDIRCQFTSSFNDRKEWEEFIRVETPEETLTLDFTNPYVKNDPFSLHIKGGVDRLEDRTIRVSYEESFKCEIEHFVACINDDAEVMTTFREGRDDVAGFIEMFRMYLEDR
ncbi:Gfo/Idh/MocA family protein [Haladaptatus sp. CMAA 1911]|uniref:Gfo/Idh/MocA family protein n=1 Tax=unclassified Haladaptatus TaxID=2622732 RepID=UPI00375526D3